LTAATDRGARGYRRATGAFLLTAKLTGGMNPLALSLTVRGYPT
jgi:hypothetical protein